MLSQAALLSQESPRRPFGFSEEQAQCRAREAEAKAGSGHPWAAEGEGSARGWQRAGGVGGEGCLEGPCQP